MRESDIIVLGQLIDSLNYSLNELEDSVNKKNPKKIERLKKAILEFQGKIDYLTRSI